jgi:hypothetical protein
MDELMAEAQAKAKIDVDDMITNIAAAAAWTQDERRSSLLDADNLLGGTGSGASLPPTIQVGADDKKDDELKRRAAKEALGLVNVDGNLVPPPTVEEFISLRFAEAMNPNNPTTQGGNYSRYRDLSERAEFGSLPGGLTDYEMEEFSNSQKYIEEKAREDWEKEYGESRNKYDTALNNLSKNGFTFSSEKEAIEFLQDNYQDINRQWQVDLITPASITNSANSDAFSAALASLERNVPITMDIIVSDYSDYGSEKKTLRKYIQEQVAGNQTKTEAAENIQLDNKELVSVRADGSFVFKIRYGNKKESELMFTVESNNPNLQKYTAPMRELTNIFYPADENAKRNVRTLLAAGESIPLSYRPGRIVAQFLENDQIVSEQLIQPEVELMYNIDRSNSNQSEIGVKLTVKGKEPIFMPIGEYMAQLRRNTTEYIATEGL